VLDFTTTNAYLVDFTQQYTQKQFTTLQCVYIDNSQNLDELSVIVNGTNQTITAPPQSQGFYEVLATSSPKFNIETNGNLIVQVIFLNFYIPPTVYQIEPVNSAGLPEIDIPALDAIITGNALNVVTQPFTITGVTDNGGAVAAGGTIAVPASATRKRWIISNPDTATETLDIRLGSNVASPIPLLPGMTWDESDSSIVGDVVYVTAATVGHAFTAYYW
jgi:hypothetical protein